MKKFNKMNNTSQGMQIINIYESYAEYVCIGYIESNPLE